MLDGDLFRACCYTDQSTFVMVRRVEPDGAQGMGSVSKDKLALDYATRNLIAETVRETVRSEIRACALEVNQVPVPQLHGPCSMAAEEFVLGAVLCGPQSTLGSASVRISRRRHARSREQGPHCDPRALLLKPSDFWARINQLYFLAMIEAKDPTDIPALIEWLWIRDRITGPQEWFVSELEEYRSKSFRLAALYEVASACALIISHSHSRKLVHELARLADGLCAQTETVETAKSALRELFRSLR